MPKNFVPSEKRILFLVVGAFAAFATIGILLTLLRNIPSDNFFSRLFAKPTPTPFKYSKFALPVPLPTGKQVYKISRGEGSRGPNIQEVTIDPFDSKKGELQKIDVKVKGDATVSAVKVTLISDDQAKTYDAKLAEGTNHDGIWQAKGEVSGNRDYVYRVMVDASDSKNNSSVTLTIR